MEILAECTEDSEETLRLRWKALVTATLLLTTVMTSQAAQRFRRLPAKEYTDKMKAG